MTKEEAIISLKKYGEIRLEQQFIQTRLEHHSRRLAAAEKDHDKGMEQHRIDELEKVAEENRRYMEDVEVCLDCMPPRQRRVLWHFYVRRSDDYIEILNEKLNVERSQIYRIKTKAEQTFAALYTKTFY